MYPSFYLEAMSNSYSFWKKRGFVETGTHNDVLVSMTNDPQLILKEAG